MYEVGLKAQEKIDSTSIWRAKWHKKGGAGLSLEILIKTFVDEEGLPEGSGSECSSRPGTDGGRAETRLAMSWY